MNFISSIIFTTNTIKDDEVVTTINDPLKSYIISVLLSSSKFFPVLKQS